jgi:hypothetical protein
LRQSEKRLIFGRIDILIRRLFDSVRRKAEGVGWKVEGVGRKVEGVGRATIRRGGFEDFSVWRRTFSVADAWDFVRRKGAWRRYFSRRILVRRVFV